MAPCDQKPLTVMLTPVSSAPLRKSVQQSNQHVSRAQQAEISLESGRSTHQTECAHLHVISWAVLLGVVREDCGAVEGAVILWEVQPAFEAMGTLPTDANANDVG